MSASNTAVPRRKRWSRLRKLTIGLLAVLVVLTGAGFTYETIAEYRDRRNFPPPGQMVDVGDFRMHLNVIGEPTSGPTVILEHGGGGMSVRWGWIQPQIAEFA